MTGRAHDLAQAVRGRAAPDGRIPAADVAVLVAAFSLADPDPVLLAALPLAAALADPRISAYRVAAVGLEAETGDLLLGGNLEFRGTDLTRTVHAEGAVAIQAFLRGTSIATLALDEARPCAFCRQMLTEFAWAPSLRIIDPHGHERSMAELYPWPFMPEDLDLDGAVPGRVGWPDLRVDDASVPAEVAAALVAAGCRAHAPYSRCPAAAVLRLADGRLVAGATIENVAFDPTVGPLQAALVALRGSGDGYAAIESAYLAVVADGAVDDIRPSRTLLDAIAPGVALTAVPWSTS